VKRCRLRALHACSSLIGLLSGCGDTGQEHVGVPLYVAGTDASEGVFAADGVPVVVERADLAFGPLYLCAGSQAGDLCDTARLEWLDSVVVDMTDPEPVRAGKLAGETGQVRSWMYDLGISSLLTQRDPFVLEAAAELGGVSLVLAGRAQVEGVELPFRAELPIQLEEENELGIPIVRSRPGEASPHEVRSDESGLLVRFDSKGWIQGMDFGAYIEDERCAAGGRELVCAGNVEQRCTPDGNGLETRDCAAFGEVCVANEGCVERVIIETGTQAYRSLRSALATGERPRFQWAFSP
jgi:hypothetical protein